jgi:hypothetical protein
MDVTRRRPHRCGVWLGVALVGLVANGCGVAGPESRTFVGPVTVINSHTVCIGGPDASGECFVKDQMTKSLRVSDCVRVTYVLHDSPGPSTAWKIQRLDPATHAADCPRQ